MQDAWMVRKAEKILEYEDRNERKIFFKSIKAIYGPCIQRTAPLLSSNGTTLLTEKSKILKCWAEHFRSVHNRSSAISNAASDRLPQVDTNNDLDLPPSLPETIRCGAKDKFPGISKTSGRGTGKSVNHKGISLLNIAGRIFARNLLNRLNGHLEQGLLPESQCGFGRHRGTTDMIFAARQLQEKC
ncbi:unnamed protein product [Schistocephalus solidus]|uniref:Reverse transcriptase domain-containing protein n=1 Tax=Schistocephalus solidus TaxID=70667 RepID=A0A183SW25_SCHSO|nr:unnamed protein product [Schistocephalus solidus]